MFIMAIDQGTTSSRAIIFNHAGQIVSSGQLEHEQIFPRAGWVEHNPDEIRNSVNEVMGQAFARARINRHQIAAVGITNQRETTLVWDRETGEPVYNAIVWQDTRTAKIVDELGGGDQDKYKDRVGQVISSEVYQVWRREVLLVDDVMTAGTAVREVIPKLKAEANVEVVGLVLSVDRMEKTKDSDMSAVKAVEAEFGFPVLSIANVREIFDAAAKMKNPDGTPLLSHDIQQRAAAYLEEYGA